MQTLRASKPCSVTEINTGFNMRKRLGALLVVAISLGAYSVGACAEGRKLYRYYDEQGVQVVDWKLPKEAAARGYEVLTEQGVVLQYVAPVAVGEDLDKSLKAKAEAERLRKWDESLLRKYSAVEDIEDARDRSLGELNIRISILQSNLRSLRQSIENQQSRLATIERDGRKAPDADYEQIADLREEVASTERAIEERQQEIDNISAEYQRDIDRFKEIQGLVEQRRKLSIEDSG